MSWPRIGMRPTTTAITTMMMSEMIHISGALVKSGQPSPIHFTPSPAGRDLPGITSLRSASAATAAGTADPGVLMVVPLFAASRLRARLLLQRHVNKHGRDEAH